MAAASVLAVGALTALGLPATSANASYPGTGSVLTAASGYSITVQGGGTFTPSNEYVSGVDSVAWSPDGSRAVFASHQGEIATMRFDDDTDIWYVEDAEPSVERRQVTWRGAGSVAWAERDSGGVHRIMGDTSSYGWTPWQITPDDGAEYTNPDGALDGRLVYQRGANAVVLHDFTLGDTAAEQQISLIANAANPAFSPDGTKVAFVRAGNIWVLTINEVSDTADDEFLQITTSGSDDNPTWSPNGQTLAFSNSGSVKTVPAAGGTATSAGITGIPAYRPGKQNKVVRLAGANRFGTAVSVSKSLWADGAAQSVTLSRSDNFADALGGSALAAAKQGPLLMTPPTVFNVDTKAEIIRVLGPGTGKMVYILGDVGAVSASTEAQIKSLGYNVTRLGGANRYSTSVKIAEAITPDPDYVLAATGKNFPDALAAGAAAGSYNMPGSNRSAVVVLTNDGVLPADTKAYVDAALADSSAPTEIFGIGGQAVQAMSSVPAYQSVLMELNGDSRYETALYVGQVFFAGSRVAGVAVGTNWPDALAGGAMMATLNGPLLLTPGNNLNIETAWHLDVSSGSIDTGYVFGDVGVVSNTVATQIGTWISANNYTQSSNPAAINALAMRSLNPSAAANGNLRSTAEIKAAAGELPTRDQH